MWTRTRTRTRTSAADCVFGGQDSVPAGAGINDNGSGSSSNLAVALAMARAQLPLVNQVRFCWWAAEELGLLGSSHYVAQLNASEFRRIALNINIDMVRVRSILFLNLSIKNLQSFQLASPNYVMFVDRVNENSTKISNTTSETSRRVVIITHSRSLLCQ